MLLKHAEPMSNAAAQLTSGGDCETHSARGILIINADDWGGWKSATDAALACHQQGRITSVSAMVFMEDAERGAALANETGVDAGLHVNLTEPFTGKNIPARLMESQERTRRFLKRSRRSLLVYNPFLCKDFNYLFEAQLEEFCRLYGRAPSHFDGHQHMHLCTNMLLDGVIPSGERVRRSFSFWPGEKGVVNRTYRKWVDSRLAKNYVMTDYFFSLARSLQANSLGRIVELAKRSAVELMTHPEKSEERAWLLGSRMPKTVQGLRTARYVELPLRN